MIFRPAFPQITVDGPVEFEHLHDLLTHVTHSKQKNRQDIHRFLTPLRCSCGQDVRVPRHS
jgi:hypothetical protein